MTAHVSKGSHPITIVEKRACWFGLAMAILIGLMLAGI